MGDSFVWWAFETAVTESPELASMYVDAITAIAQYRKSPWLQKQVLGLKDGQHC